MTKLSDPPGTVRPMTATPTGIHPDIPMNDYLAAPGLSASSARKLLPPYCPALYRQMQLTPERSAAMDLGTIAHSVILEGTDLATIAVEVPGNWSHKGPKDAKAAAEEAGLIPLHTDDWHAVSGMVAGIRQNRLASALFDPAHGKPEQSMFWTDPAAGVPRKGRLDFLPERRRSGRLVIPDFKSTACAETSKWATSALNLGYHQQAAAYVEGCQTLGLDDDPLILFVVQETRPPYLVNVVQLGAEEMAIGRHLNRRACRVYAECLQTGIWPGYPGETEPDTVTYPRWYTSRFDEADADQPHPEGATA